MSRRTDQEFEDVAQQVSTRAAQIDCSPADYRDGLEIIIAVLREDIAASRDLDAEP